MMNRQIEEALQSAKVFVLQAVDDVALQARRFFDRDAETDRGSGFQSKEEVPTEGAPDEEVEVWLDESDGVLLDTSEDQSEDWSSSEDGPSEDRVQGEPTARSSEIGPIVDEELFLAAAGDGDDEDPFDDEPDLPKVRPSLDSLGEEMARAMLINASGGSSDDEPVDDVDPIDRIAVEPEP